MVTSSPPDPFDVLTATLGPHARPVPLEAATIVRTAERPDHAAGNAVHHTAPLPPAELEDALVELDRRFPAGASRLVVPHDPELAAAVAERAGVRGRRLDVLLLDDAASAVGGWVVRDDLRLAPPGDDRAWHGATVLHRHAGRPHEDRSRGAADDLLRWRVEGHRTLVEQGRARALRAERFGTPVGTGLLVWEPRAVVDPPHAGLAVVTDVVVHPAHRALGVARTLVAGLLTRHLADFPRARVAAVRPAAVDEHPAAPTGGWRVHARLLAISRRD